MRNSPRLNGPTVHGAHRWVTAISILVLSLNLLPAQTVPASGLVGYWAGNGNANDGSSLANHGAFSGTYVPGIVGQAFQITSGTYVTIQDIPTYAFSDMSVDFWFKGAVGSGSFIGQDDGGGGFPKWFVDYGYGNPGKFEMHLNGVATAGFFPSNAVTLDNAWHNLAVVKTGATYDFYYDGISIGSATASGSAFSNPISPLIFGFAEVAVANYTGLIDEVVLYNRPLTVAEVQQLAAIPEPAVASALAALLALGCGFLRKFHQPRVSKGNQLPRVRG